MKALILKSTLLAAVLALAPAAVHAETATPAPAAEKAKGKAPAMDKIQYEGTLTALDATAKTITVKVKEESMTFAILETTKILKDKQPAKLEDFAAGDSVTGSYVKDASGKMSAASLHKKTAKAAGKPAAAAKKAAQ